MINGILTFLAELRRRNVYRVGIAYIVVALVALETVDMLIPSTVLPGWVDEFLLAIAIIGWPIAVFAAWALELTPDGIRVTPKSSGANETADAGIKPVVSFLAAVVVLVLLVGAWWSWHGQGDEQTASTDHAIAVLPFETLGEDRPNSFTQGIHLGVLTRLSDVSDLHVISRTSVNVYQDTQKTLPEIARELGVSWVLRAEVQESGSSVQINARLLDAASDRQVWAKDYRRELTASNLFDIQTELATAIIVELKSRLTPFERSRIDSAPTGDLMAYRLVAEGRNIFDLRTEASVRKAIELFEQATVRDPNYAMAWVGVADGYAILYDYGFDRDRVNVERSRRAVNKALGIDPMLAEAHASLGLLEGALHDGPTSIESLSNAIQLRPGYADAHTWRAFLYVSLGSADAALESARQAVVLDPLSGEALSNLSLAFLANGDAERALELALESAEALPGWNTALFYEALALYHLARYDEARAVLEGLTVEWTGHGAEALLAMCHAALGEVDAAGRIIADMRAREDLVAVGLIQASLGNVDEALRTLARNDDWGHWAAMSLREFFPGTLARLRLDPGYDEIIERINAYWKLGS